MTSGQFPPQLQVLRCGVHYKHTPDFVVERPHGSGDWVWVQFLSPVHLSDSHGVHRLPAGAHIVHSPDFPHWYSGVENAMEANWMHFSGDVVPSLLESCDIAANCAFLLQTQPVFQSLITAIERERSRNEVFENEVSTLLAIQLLFQLGRALKQQHELRMTAHQAVLREALHDVRLRIMHQPQYRWTIGEMAQQAHLSPSRFATLYREFFGVSPLEDVLRARMERACWLLLNTDAVVAKVAEECGFNNMAHFSRTFTRRIGCPPSRYYTCSRNVKESNKI